MPMLGRTAAAIRFATNIGVYGSRRARGDAERERMRAPAQGRDDGMRAPARGRDDGLRISACYGIAIRPREKRFE